MAMSFSRPDPSSPNAVASAAFTPARRGYDQGEVRDFLRMVAAELARLQEREKFLERELRNTQRSKPTAAVALDEEVVTRMLGEEAARILQTARDGAGQIRTRAEENAARMVREATDEAQRRREEAEIESSRRRQDASADAEAELEMAKQQGREMVNEARAYRERVLSELSRRRELARQQIEQLVHGRDRLLQAFERARIAAVDVMAELTPLGEPNEYVNLTPTTGPVPLMVPGRPAPGTEPRAVHPVVEEAAAAAEREAAAGEAAQDGAELDEAADLDIVAEVYDADLEDTDDEDDAEAEYDDAAEYDDDAEDDDDAELVEAEADDEAEFDDEADDDDVVEAELDDEAEAEADDEAEIDDDEADDDDDIVEADADADDADADDADEDDRELAPVVALFAGELDVPAPADAPVQAEPAGSSAPAATVDDLFARLRAARADSVVRKLADRDTEATEATEATEPAAAVAPSPAPVEPAPVDDTVVLSVFARSPEAPAADTPDALDSPFARRDAALTPLIVAGARKLKRVLADEQNDVLHALRRPGDVAGLVPSTADHVQRYAHAVADELRHAGLAGAAGLDGREAATHERDIVKADAVRPAVEALAESLVVPLRDRLDRAVADAAGDHAELTEHVRSIYREWKTQRIDESFEDVVRQAYGHGALAAVPPARRCAGRWTQAARPARTRTTARSVARWRRANRSPPTICARRPIRGAAASW